MNTMDESSFDVLAMAQEMADANGVAMQDLFNNNPADVAEPPPPEESPNPSTEVSTMPSVGRKPWKPSEEALEELPELKQTPKTYTMTEIDVKPEGLQNITDDTARKEAVEAMDELSRKLANIEDAKKRHGIKNFQIPEGIFQVRVYNAAIDVDYDRAQKNLDEIFNEIENVHPEFIRDWIPGYGPDSKPTNPMKDQLAGDMDLPEGVATTASEPIASETVETTTPDTSAPTAAIQMDNKTADEVKVVIDKTNVPQVSWDPEDLDKIRKARTVVLNIVESNNLEFSAIEDVPENAVDAVLAQYQRKTNDIVASLPASKYRATFTGLSYPEVLDLSNSNEMNNLDGEKAKWTIAYRHIRNQSIGPWESYRWYIDPNTKNKVKIPKGAPDPAGIDPEVIFNVSEFDDFLMKTSFMDLEFILWKILCATSLDKEIISIDCKAIHNGKPCNKNYDWIYSPEELLLTSSVNPGVLEDMKKTGEVMSTEDIMTNFRSSVVNADNTVKLSGCGFQVIFGHVSAFDYLNTIYADIKKFEEADENDPTLISRGLNYTTLTAIKGFLLPKPDGTGKYRITGSKNIVKILQELNEVDWQTVSEIVRMMLEPYQFDFALRDLVCPHCGSRSTIPITDMKTLLFIVARSLSSVQIELKRT